LTTGRLKILLSGMVAGDPGQGGATWAVLQYLAGLRELGHEVVLVEPVAAEALVPGGAVVSYFDSLPLPKGGAALMAVGGEGAPGPETVGIDYRDLVAFAREADLLLNISGLLRDERLLEPIATRAFLDLDPGFNQVWEATDAAMGFALHTHFVTVGGLVGSEGCPIPTLGREWIPTLPPVALPHWPAQPPTDGAFTTVGHWRSYGSIEYGGVHYGQRAHSLRRLIDLPRRSGARIELALGIHPDEGQDLRALREKGWILIDPDRVAGTPEAFAAFVGGSRAELSVAKSGYVDSRSGWFSDRSAAYLASGRPVVAQDTGFGVSLPTGEGLVAFSDSAGAVEAIAAVEGEYGRHAAAARELAVEYLDARRVLGRLLEQLA
jgi:hypothetical protein